MNIWLVTIGEPLPIDRDSNQRLYRTGILANKLVGLGHNVVWWNSTFDHISKFQRYPSDTTIYFDNGICAKLIHGYGYKKNVSLRRIADHLILAIKFYNQAKHMPVPDIILCSFPPIELSYSVSLYGKKRSIPVVMDIRDLWPDIFLEYSPQILKPLAILVISLYRLVAKFACKSSFAILGNNPAFVNWGLSFCSRAPTKFDRHFPFGYEINPLSKTQIELAKNFWDDFSISKNSDIFTICFFGSIGNHFDFDTVIEAAKILYKEKINVRFVICGDGEKLNYFKSKSNYLNSLIFPGWIGRAEILELMDRSHVGLAPYKNHIGFIDNLPNKPIEYFSSGLPVISCIKGYFANLIETHKCGLTYESSNPYSLVEIIKFLITNSNYLAYMSHNSKNLYESKFSAEIVYGEMVEYLKNIVSEVKK